MSKRVREGTREEDRAVSHVDKKKESVHAYSITQRCDSQNKTHTK